MSHTFPSPMLKENAFSVAQCGPKKHENDKETQKNEKKTIEPLSQYPFILKVGRKKSVFFSQETKERTTIFSTFLEPNMEKGNQQEGWGAETTRRRRSA